jgi:cytochrome c556
MKRVALAVVALGLAVTSLGAQSDPVRERAALMKEQGRAVYGTLNRMARGQEPFDQARIDQAFATLSRTTSQLPALYASAKGQSSDSDYFANSKVWDNKSDFDVRLARLKSVVQEQQAKAQNLDGLKAAAGSINDVCNGCHEAYRSKKG